MGLSPGQNALIANGLVVGPLDEGEKLGDEDIGLLEKVLVARGAQVSEEKE